MRDMSASKQSLDQLDEGQLKKMSASSIDREMRTLMARSRSFSAQMSRHVHPDLNPAVYGTLIDITEREPVRAVDLAERRGVSKALVSREIRTLERLGMVERQTDEVDGRAQVLTSTAIGREAAGQAMASRLEYTRRLLESCTSEELLMMVYSLRRLNEMLDFSLPMDAENLRGTEIAGEIPTV